MTSSVWNGNPIPSTAINADGSYKQQVFSGFNFGDTVLTLTAFAYAPGTGSLWVEVNGVDQVLNIDYIETSPSIVTMVTGLVPEDVVVVKGFVGGVASQNAATSAAQAAASATAALGYLNAILALTPPSLPLSIANGGTGQTSKTNAYDALSPSTTKGDLTIYNGTDNVRLPVSADDMVLCSDTTTANGVLWQYDKPKKIAQITSNGITVDATYAGKLIVACADPSIGGDLTITIDLAATLKSGFTTYIKHSDLPPTAIAFARVKIQLSGSDIFRDTGDNYFYIPYTGAIGIQGNGVDTFTVFAASGVRNYFKLQQRQATGVSNGAAVLGLNNRIPNTTVINTLGYDPILPGSPNFITLPRGVWQYKITTIHSGTAATRLELLQVAGSIVSLRGPNNPPNSLVNIFSGRLEVTGQSLGFRQFMFREWFSAAGGTLGSAINDGNPEVYVDIEFIQD